MHAARPASASAPPRAACACTGCMPNREPSGTRGLAACRLPPPAAACRRLPAPAAACHRRRRLPLGTCDGPGGGASGEARDEGGQHEPARGGGQASEVSRMAGRGRGLGRRRARAGKARWRRARGTGRRGRSPRVATRRGSRQGSSRRTRHGAKVCAQGHNGEIDARGQLHRKDGRCGAARAGGGQRAVVEGSAQRAARIGRAAQKLPQGAASRRGGGSADTCGVVVTVGSWRELFTVNPQVPIPPRGQRPNMKKNTRHKIHQTH